MPQISLTEFIDIASSTGASKLKKIRKVRYKPPYHPMRDQYKQVREHLAGHVINNMPPDNLKSVVPSLIEWKRAHAGAILDGYAAWTRNKTVTAFPVTGGTYSAGGLDVRVVPDYGIALSGVRHVVKNYFNIDPISLTKIQLALALMEAQLRPECQPDDFIGIFDTRQRKFHPATAEEVALLPLLHAEMALIATLWQTV